MDPKPLYTFTKDPDAKLGFGLDWSYWLEPGRSIRSSRWFVHGDATGVTIGSGQYAPKHNATRAWLYPIGGLVGRTYLLTNEIEDDSSPPNRDQRTIAIRIVER